MSIIVQLQGGLGNQMFQYAFAKGMSRRHHTDFLLDTFGYQRSPRPYELEHFAIQPSYAQKADLPRWQGDKYANRTKMRILNRIAKPLLQKLDRHTYLEAEGVGFDPRLLEPKQGYFLGRFQNEKYFMEPTLQSELRKDFSFLSLPSQQNAQVIEEMEQTLSVSVHIRRGDYLNPEYQGFF
ncbi:MAG: hypothetical protein LBO09_08320 [Candidatus Peribacteria bacterium]|jgi:hypothetical protein|nr:hypothetical protein [Candidatus Peribacteria bacterium]